MSSKLNRRWLFVVALVSVLALVPATVYAQSQISTQLPVLPNRVYIGGQDQNAINRAMIGFDSSGRVSIDPDARGAIFAGAVTFTGSPAITGNLSLTGNLSVTGTTTLTGALSAGAGTFSSTLDVTGAITVPTTVQINLNAGATTYIYEQAAGVLGLVGGTEIRVFQSTSRTVLAVADAQVFQLRSASGNITFAPGGTTERWAIDASGAYHFSPSSDNVYDIGYTGGRINELWPGGTLHQAQGTSAASASSLDLAEQTGNTFEITGTTTIDMLDTTGYQNGDTIRLLFTDVLTIANNQTPAGDTARFLMDSSGNITTRANMICSFSLTTSATVRAWRSAGCSSNG